MSKTYNELREEELNKRAYLTKRVKAGYILSIVFSALSILGVSISWIDQFAYGDFASISTSIAFIVCGGIFLNKTLKSIEKGEKYTYLGVLGIIFGFIFAGIYYLRFNPKNFEDLHKESSDYELKSEDVVVEDSIKEEIKEEPITKTETDDSIKQQLLTLKELYEKEVITLEEYEAKKAELLEQIK